LVQQVCDLPIQLRVDLCVRASTLSHVHPLNWLSTQQHNRHTMRSRWKMHCGLLLQSFVVVNSHPLGSTVSAQKGWFSNIYQLRYRGVETGDGTSWCARLVSIQQTEMDIQLFKAECRQVGTCIDNATRRHQVTFRPHDFKTPGSVIVNMTQDDKKHDGLVTSRIHTRYRKKSDQTR